MEFKAQLEKEPLSYKRQHVVRRLAKAAQLASQLSDLASKRCDDRTSLEAEAYALFMAGNLLFEKQQWEAALAKLVRAKLDPIPVFTFTKLWQHFAQKLY